MKISILCSNLSSNALGRAYLLAKVLQRSYRVEILGPTFGDSIWPPCDLPDVTYKTVPGSSFPRFFGSAQRLLRLIDGDLIYAVKPRLTSFGIGMLAKRALGVPLILDIDDWDQKGAFNLPWWRRAARSLRVFFDPYANPYVTLMEKLIPRADAVTVVSRLLQQRFGGIYLPHGRDTEYLNPNMYSDSIIREYMGLVNHRIVMFLGTPKPHKGLEELIVAINQLNDLPVMLVIVGATPGESYTQRLAQMGGDRIRLIGLRPFHEIPQFLAAADVVALPQWDVPFARAQVPAKVFDAMSMARPIVATRVGDLAEILTGCALLVPPNDITSLSSAIHDLLINVELAQELGSKARERCIDKYSWNVMEETLESLLGQTLLQCQQRSRHVTADIN